MIFYLPDTRPYPNEPIKNDILLYASQVAHNHGATQKLARENLHTQIKKQFEQNHTLGLSVAMSMAPDVATYRALMDEIAQVLNAKNDTEIQWFILPVILVAGSKEQHTLTSHAPITAIKQVLNQHSPFNVLTQATWLPQLICADDLARIKADDWFAAKLNLHAAEQFTTKLTHQPLNLPAEQSIHTLYALGYGQPTIQAAIGKNLREAALPLMQVWQKHLTQTGLTLFTNPLNPNNPIDALADARFMRLRMALDVFAANAIRAIRLKNARVGVVMAAEQGGKLLFGFDTTDNNSSPPSHVFTWQLSPYDNIANIQQNFLDLMADCQVDNLYLLHDALPEQKQLPNYQQAHTFMGHHPLLNR